MSAAYTVRVATEGGTLAALRAGCHAANWPSAHRSATPPTRKYRSSRGRASLTDKPYPIARASTQPTATPVVVINPFSTMKYWRMSDLRAPTARRVPICLVRLLTLKVVRPDIPRHVTLISSRVTTLRKIETLRSPEKVRFLKMLEG